MSRTLTISDELDPRLREKVHAFGTDSIEHFLEITHRAFLSLSDEELRRRQEAVAQTIATQERLSVTLGMMPDSADLVREDHER